LRCYGCAAALAALVLAGCDRPQRAHNPPETSTTGTVERHASDSLITARIQAKYFAAPDVKAHRIDVDTNGGLVTLEGTVDTDAQRQTAGDLARSVEGVTRVENELLVRPAGDGAADAPRHHAQDGPASARGRTPAWITAKIQSQYYLNPELKPWRIDVDTSSSGAVTLGGRVESEADRAEAVRIARATEGVAMVNDNLRVQRESVATSGRKETAGRSAADAIDDSWITTKVQSKFFLDDEVRARNIDVDTRDGMVTLKGTVGSEGERQQAVSIARATDGVTMVHDNLVVERGAGGTRGAGPRPRDTAVDDAWITMKIQSKYFIHDEIKSRAVDVDTNNGVVTLKGSVPSEIARNAAEVIAHETDGVAKVVNHLKVERSS
jgi:osmotically-inducible protein OsmY